MKVLKALHQRLKNIDEQTEPAELNALAEATVALAELETVEDVLALGDEKIIEISNIATQKSEELETTTETNRAELLAGKNDALSTISDAKSDGENVIFACLEEKQDTFNEFVDDLKTINDVPEDSSISSEISECLKKADFLKTGALPFIFGILSRQDDLGTTGAGGFTTAFSGPASVSAAHANGIFSLLTGCHNYTTEYAGFYEPPQLHFLQGSAGNFIYRDLYTQYAYSSGYMREAVGCLFVKNTTNQNVTTTLNFGGSGESTATYGGLGAMVGTPNFSNETISWTSISYTTGTSGTSLSGNVTIPANTTVVLLLCSTAFYITSADNCFFKVLHWQLNQIRSVFLQEGLEIDFEKTMKAWQCTGFVGAFDIFRE